MKIRASWWLLACTSMACAGRSTGNDADSAVATNGAGRSTSMGGIPGTGGSGDSDASSGLATGVGGRPSVTNGGSPASAGGAPAAGGQSASGQSASGGMGPGSGGSGGAAGGTGGTGGNPWDDELCEWGSYDADQTDDQLICEAWTECQPGEYLAMEGGFWEDSICEPCPSGTVTDAVNERRCREWHQCELGEQVVAEPTASSDRQCADSELFPPYPGRALGLLLTTEGPALMVMQNETFVASYSLSGHSVGEVTVSTGVKDGVDDQALDFACLGDELFVVGVTTSALGSPGTVRKVSASGMIDWETQLGDASDVISAAGIAAADSAVYVVALLNEGGEDAAIELYALNPLDGAVANPPLEGYPVGRPIDVAVATNAHIYVAGVGTAASGLAGVTTVTEFDATGSLIAEEILSGSRLLIQLAADDSGGVHALGGPLGYPGWHFAHHVGSGGMLLATAGLTQGEPWEMDALTSTPDGVLAVGRTLDHPVLVTADATGQVTSTEVLEDIAAPERFVGIRRTLDGTVLVAGTNVSPLGEQAAFVAQWPD